MQPPIFLLLVTLAVSLVNAEVVMVYTISRHGARNRLPKTAKLTENDSAGGPTLLPQGQRMCWNAGQAFRARYIDRATCGTTCLPVSGNDTGYGLIQRGTQPGKGFHNYNTRVRSSVTDRTILSAQSFYAGVFPADATVDTKNGTEYLPNGQQIVPIYTQDKFAGNNDWLIQAYTKCPTYQQRLTDWYNSDEFQAKSAASQALRDKVKQLTNGELDTSLKNWWNVFDGLNVWFKYGVGDPVANTFDAATLNATADLAAWLETAKMRPSLTSNLLGGPLAGDMMGFFQAAARAVQGSQPVYYKLLSISSHYNTQLGVLAALGLHNYPPAVAKLPWLTATLPQLASVVVFELHAVPNVNKPDAPVTMAARLAVQQGDKANYITVPMPCAVEGDAAQTAVEPGACTLDNFIQLLSNASLSTPEAWCAACSNTDATDCQLVNAQAQTQALSTQQQNSSGSKDDHLGLAIGLSVGLTFLATALLAAGIAGVLMARRRNTPHRLSSGGLSTGLADYEPPTKVQLAPTSSSAI